MPATKRQSKSAAAPGQDSGPQNGISAYAMPTNASQNHANANASGDSFGYGEQQAAQERIGDVLRRMRERHRGDLKEIADYLRIKHSFLSALENSRYNEIPADAYVIGFLRTYAEFLGFDGKEAIDRYRKEMEGRRRKTILTMPIPIGEGRAPSAMLIAGAAMAALLVYVAWYGVSNSDRATVTSPPVIATAPPTAPDYQAMPPAVDPNPALQPALTQAPSQTPPPLLQPQQANDSVVGQAGAIAGTVLPQAPVANIPAAIANEVGSLPSGISISGPPPSGSGAQTQEQPQTDQKEGATSVAAPTASLAASPSSAASAPQPAAPPKVSSRIVIRADQTSWVLIADSRGNVVLDKVLKPGNTYEVPDQPGLKMTTGNSAGLALVIDGTSVIHLPGDSSKILRNVPLDPAHLKAQSPSPSKPQD